MKKALLSLAAIALFFVSCEQGTPVTPDNTDPNTEEPNTEEPNTEDPNDDIIEPDVELNTLKDVVEAIRPDFELGVFYSGVEKNADDQAKHDKIVAEQFHGITIWAGMVSMWHGGDKWRFDEEYMDSRYKYACQNDMIMHIHPLIGPDQYMGWWLQTNHKLYTDAELQRFMNVYITTVLERYPAAQYCDVVNEALDGLNKDGSIKWANETTPWIGMGWYNGEEGGIPQYMIDSYKIAREVRPDMKFIYNENTNSMANTPKGMACYEAVKAINETGEAKIDAVGFQMHLRYVKGKFAEGYTYNFDFKEFNKMINMYAEIGVDVYITEFDVELGQNPTEADFKAQGKMYADVLAAALMNENVKGFTTWGLSDKYSWVRDWVLGSDGLPFNCQPLMYDANFEPKPAFTTAFETLKVLAE